MWDALTPPFLVYHENKKKPQIFVPINIKWLIASFHASCLLTRCYNKATSLYNALLSSSHGGGGGGGGCHQ